ncbi:MAG: antibiotic biosynthesis monooxygenase [Deltaproteobacteria bacterium]|nr:antibiotic biosynthesis monooxygenase [Deltaproteobacteria bacterium]
MTGDGTNPPAPRGSTPPPGLGGGETVTVVVRHHLQPGAEVAFADWIEGISAASRQFEGYLGTEVTRPRGGPEPQRICVFRFTDVERLDRWMTSPERAAWLKKLGTLGTTEPQIDQFHGLEAWFPPSRETPSSSTPVRWKMAAVTFAAIWPLVHFVPRAVTSSLPAPPLALEALSTGVIVVLMTYLVMPKVTGLLGSWLRR